MTERTTLLGFIAQRYTGDLEDVATDALAFILSGSSPARRALSEFLSDNRGQLPIAQVRSWGELAHGAVPDLVCHDDDDNLVAFIESKFWAQLTQHQPVTYWRALPADRPAVLLFLAPESRIDDGWLWEELVNRLRVAGHEMGPPEMSECLVTASASADERRLMLTSWQWLLDTMAAQTRDCGDAQACFEIEELQGLAAGAIAGDHPRSDENLRGLIQDAVKRLEQSDWANAEGFTAGAGHDYYARYLRLAGASAGLLIHYKALKATPDKPLWLWFYADAAARVSVDTVRDRLGRLIEPGLGWLREEVCVPIALPAGADTESTLDAIVSELEVIAELIDPDGPTFRTRC